jgi:hypothetical protein
VPAALSVSVSPALEIHRVVGGLSLFAYFCHNLANRGALVNGLGAIGSVLVAAGIGRHAVRWALFGVAAAVRHRIGAQGDIDDYLATCSAFWLACLPIADSFPFGSRTQRRDQLRAGRVVRGALVTWFSLTLLLAAPWAAAFGKMGTPPAIRAITALLIALLVWQPGSVARWCALSMFILLVGSLLAQFGATISASMLLAFGALVWAPELDLISGAERCDPDPSIARRLDALGVVAWTMVAALTVALFFGHGPVAHKAFDVLTDTGLEPQFGWRLATDARRLDKQDRTPGGPP